MHGVRASLALVLHVEVNGEPSTVLRTLIALHEAGGVRPLLLHRGDLLSQRRRRYRCVLEHCRPALFLPACTLCHRDTLHEEHALAVLAHRAAQPEPTARLAAELLSWLA